LPKFSKDFSERLSAANSSVGKAEANACDGFVALGSQQADGIVDQLLLGLVEAEFDLLGDEGLQVGWDFDGHRQVSVSGL
jgi:hypothetical protein